MSADRSPWDIEYRRGSIIGRDTIISKPFFPFRDLLLYIDEIGGSEGSRGDPVSIWPSNKISRRSSAAASSVQGESKRGSIQRGEIA